MSFIKAAHALRASFVAAFAVAALSSTAANADPEVLFRAAHSSTPSSTGHIALEYLDKNLREKTDGRVGIEIFPNSQLGGERELIENIQFGNVDLIYVSTAPVASFSPAFFAFDIPFLFQNREQVYAVLDGDIGTELLATLEDKGIVGLGYWENGFRQLHNGKKEVRTPEDLAGMKMRTMENEVHIAAFRELGANPAPLAFNELFTALQQGTFDGAEGPINLFRDMKFNEVQNHISKTNHLYSPWALLANPEKLAALSPEDREVFDAAIKDSIAFQRELSKKADDAAEAEMTTVTFTTLTPEELAKFSAKIGPIVEVVKAKAGADLVERIQAVTAQ